MSRLLTAFLAVLVWVVAIDTTAIQPARAMESTPVTSPRDVARLVSNTDAIQPGQPFRVGLWLRMAPGWHTYWKDPGDAGVPADLTIAGVKQSPIAWPAPKRISEGPVMSYAYTGEVLLPVTVTARTGLIKAHADWLVCKEICVPEQGDFTLNLPIGTPSPSKQAPLFAAHDRAMPRVSPWKARFAPNGTLFVQGPELSVATVKDAWFIPDAADRIENAAPQTLSVRAGGFTLALKPAAHFQPTKPLTGVLTVKDRSGQLTNVLVQAEPGAAPPPASPPLAQILVFAFLGGIILNLMPCVFPILAMKAVGLAKHAGRGHGHSISYTAGILVTFLALAGLLLGARAAGIEAGWGFQFSSPVFVAAMAWLLFAVGLNLSGVFEVGAGLTGVGGGLAGRHGVAGSFFTGLLAVLVATPCTAPFMGVAVAAGLAAPPLVTVLVFGVMGLGLAAPYVALAAMPGLAALMPRPGRWMEVFKQVLAFPMYGAAAWLVWVLSEEAGSAGVLAAAIGLVLIGFAGWVYGATQGAAGRSRRFGQAAAVLALVAAGVVASGVTSVPVDAASSGAAAGTAHADAFSAKRLAALRAEGKPVFVDMTAAWCVTCLVNERVALSATPVQDAFAKDGVVYMKGDWTRQDPAITAFLKQYGRDGVPLYVFYPAHGGQPVVLPQILTEGTVLAVLRGA